MKKIYFRGVSFLFFLFVISGIVSCKKGGFLAPTTISNLNQSSVFADSSNTNQFLANIYSQLGFAINVNQFGNGGLDAAGDESQQGNKNPSQVTDWVTGTINAANVTDGIYADAYAQIRAVNLLLANISHTKLNLPSGVPGSRDELKAEAKFLRAWYYAELLRHYGGVVLVGNNIYDYTSPIPQARATYAQTVQYIVSQCDSAALGLPLTQSGTNYGRASKGACLALKARVLLYAASPLYSVSGNVASGNALTGYVGADSSAYRWALAKSALRAVINTGVYTLYIDNSVPGKAGNGFQALFCQRGDLTHEYILQWMLPGGNYNQQLEDFWDPPTRDGGNGGAFPYQETVDIFPMADGKAINDNTSAYTYDPQNPYVNRDPRMNYTIIHDQTVLPDRLEPTRSPVNIYLVKDLSGALSGGIDAVTIGTSTGYYTNKMLDTNATSTDATRVTKRCMPLMRFAEVLLNYAEAYNESKGLQDSAYYALESIRQRAGILPGSVIGPGGFPLFGLQPNMSQDQMRTAIMLERRLELAYEGFRYWDVRRWKTAPTELNKQFHGMEVLHTLNAGGGYTLSYNVFAMVPVHTFSNRMYFWPLPQAEIGKSKQLVQNPGY